MKRRSQFPVMVMSVGSCVDIRSIGRFIENDSSEYSMV